LKVKRISVLLTYNLTKRSSASLCWRCLSSHHKQLCGIRIPTQRDFRVLTPVRLDGSIATGDHWQSFSRMICCSQTTRGCHTTSLCGSH